MDKIEALGSTIAQISLYDIKSYYNQAKAVVLNYTEMEAKVRDATNDDPWGASSTLMQEIAQGTFNFQQFNEIMPTIYKRFTEKEAREWRQIYKALQLLEYLIKHGSERVIDDARSHISMIKILKNFHYVDDKGKDQGINVRNRAKEIAELLSDVDRVRQERRKAKAARNKYVGAGSDGPSFTSSGGSKYGGFGSDSVGFSGAAGEEWNGGGGGGSSSSGRDPYASRSSSKPADDFEEYDAGEWEDRPATRATRASVSTHRASISSAGANSISVSMKKPAEKVTAPSPKAKEVDLFSMGDDDDLTSPPAPSLINATNAQKAAVSLDDEFDEFQSAPPASSSMSTSSGPVPGASQMAAKPNVFAFLNANTPSPISSTTANSSSGSGMYGGTNMNSFHNNASTSNGGNMFGSSMMQPMINNNNPTNHAPGLLTGHYSSSATAPNSTVSNQAAAKPSKPVDQFDDLFAFAGLTKNSGSNTHASTTNGKPAQAKLSMAAMAREQSSASIWGGGSSMGTPVKPVGMGTPMGSAAPTGSTSMQNNDDLLL